MTKNLKMIFKDLNLGLYDYYYSTYNFVKQSNVTFLKITLINGC